MMSALANMTRPLGPLQQALTVQPVAGMLTVHNPLGQPRLRDLQPRFCNCGDVPM
jgi:hypothetical protein